MPLKITDNNNMSFVIFCIGAAGYSAIEYIFRGYSHWSMALTGGACLLIFYYFAEAAERIPMIVKAAVGAVIFTVVEFFVGLLVNIAYKWDVWDYSHKPLNLLGQVCPEYSVKWFFLCFLLLTLAALFKSVRAFTRSAGKNKGNHRFQRGCVYRIIKKDNERDKSESI